MSKLSEGEVYVGPAGTATEVVMTRTSDDPPDWEATVATWFLHCPRQSPAWDKYLLGVVHLRPVPGVPPAKISLHGATHELMLWAMNPDLDPIPLDHQTWAYLQPFNVVEQFVVPDDEAARELARLAAHAVANGVLPAEPPLSGQKEPWHTSIIKTSAHLRGEAHAP